MSFHLDAYLCSVRISTVWCRTGSHTAVGYLPEVAAATFHHVHHILFNLPAFLCGCNELLSVLHVSIRIGILFVILFIYQYHAHSVRLRASFKSFVPTAIGIYNNSLGVCVMSVSIMSINIYNIILKNIHLICSFVLCTFTVLTLFTL